MASLQEKEVLNYKELVALLGEPPLEDERMSNVTFSDPTHKSSGTGDNATADGADKTDGRPADSSDNTTPAAENTQSQPASSDQSS